MSQTTSLPLEIVVTFRFDSGATFGTTATVGDQGLDVATARRPSLLRKAADAPPVIPASHLRGRLRHELERMLRALGQKVCAAPMGGRMCMVDPNVASPGSSSVKASETNRAANDDSPCQVCRLFGSQWQAGRLRFSDAELIAPSPKLLKGALEVKPGVSISRRRRTAEEARLFFIERVPAGVVFQTTIRGAGTLEEAALLTRALTQVSEWGRASSRGSGWSEVSYEVKLGAESVDEKDLVKAMRQWATGHGLRHGLRSPQDR